MLHRSFKPAKCKTALKLAIPRIKLMKNKREAHVQQLKRELAQLLESGQDQTARIRVEHVVREEKTVAAYNLLEIYCELIVARMPIIESQKNCPLDLKEAISSVIFASARCEEIPELKDVSKHFTAKYGKEFTSASLELRPNCGVGRMLVEKLSANAPDGPAKLKILTAIAVEQKINWNPESFGAKESKIYDDMLNGPSTSMEATKILADPPVVQASPSHEQRPPGVQFPNYDKGTPNVQDSKHTGRSEAPASFYEHNSRSSFHPNNFDHSNASTNNSVSSGTYPPNSKPHGTENQGMEFRNSYSGNERASSSPSQHWEMKFKDATAAAQAAAESAERASMAARAAAELSSRGNISQQYSMESYMSPNGMRDEELRKYTGSSSENEHHARHPINNSLHGRDSGNYEQADRNEQHNQEGGTENVYSNIARSGDKSTHGSFKSTAASFNEKSSVNNEIRDAYSVTNSSEDRQMEHFAEVSMKRNSGGNGKQFVNELHGIKNPQNVDHHDIRDGEQSRYSSSVSQLNTSTDDHDDLSNLNWQESENDKRKSGESRMQFENELHDRKTSYDDHDVLSNINCQKSGNGSGEDLFHLNDEVSLPRGTEETTGSFDNASAVFDDYGSDTYEDNFGLEEEPKVHEYNMDFSSPGQISPSHPFTSTNSLSIEQNINSAQKSVSKSNIFSEEWPASAFFESSTSSAVPSHGDDLPATFDDYGRSSESEEDIGKSRFVGNSNPGIGSQKQNMDSKEAGNSSLNLRLVEGMEDTERSNESSLEESKELNLGNLTGGLRNKGYRRPPYSKVPGGNALSSEEAANDTSTRIKQSSFPAAVEASVSSGSYIHKPYSKKENAEVSRIVSTRAPVTQVDSSDDDSQEEQPKQAFSSTDDQYNKTPSFEESKGSYNKRSSLRTSVPYFDSGNSGSDEDLPKTSLKVHSNTRISRRTKTPLSYSRRSSNHRTTVSSEPAVALDNGEEKSLTSKSPDADEAIPKTQPQKKNSDHRESFQHSRFSSQPTSRLVSETKRYSVGGTLKSSEKEQVSSPVQKSISSGSAKSSKAQTSIEGSSKESATHVHPKLPDYDTLTAHLNSLRQNR
ncbi:hypothetical protein ERO13_D05G030000v2 [Gossypium hirsutum]|uniref:Uncharacterized protein n=1 Tax=Gossypium hirsutum TaxID=3635 RepID=A0ABM3A2F2_GOSHI|nr:uncharacterized protein LOC121217505 [Gossypium hirsutum]KAG4144325.1 hypothetical protein ERO13_D05G030000v2 [Gossypium hirsutum]